MKNFFQINYFFYAGFLLLIAALSVSAQEMPVPASVQGELLPKILLLSKGLSNKKEIVIGIVYSKFLRSSAETYEIISGEIKNSELGISFKIIPIEASGATNYRQLIILNDINCIYIAPVRGFDFSAINKTCKELKILTISAVPELVYSYFSISFELMNERPKIIINQKSIDNEGITLSSKLLKISKIYP